MIILGGDNGGFAPTFVEKPKIIPNESGSLITMKCKCKSNPKPVVTWYRGTNIVKESAKIKMITISKEEDIYEMSLEIKVFLNISFIFFYFLYYILLIILEFQDPVGSDGGAYRCHVKNEFGESNANLNLNIEAEPEPEGEGPQFVVKPRITSQQGGKLVIMDCTVRANPKPTIIWYCEGKEIKQSSKISISIEKKEEHIYYIKLTLNDPGTEDSGLYKCNIKNTLGELNANLTLNIESKSKFYNPLNRLLTIIVF